jgi:hypothetical protein
VSLCQLLVAFVLDGQIFVLLLLIQIIISFSYISDLSVHLKNEGTPGKGKSGPSSVSLDPWGLF